jgi:hypothetical protein
MRLGGGLVALVLIAPAFARAERPSGVCIEVSVDFTPTDALQIVAWLEDAAGDYVDTLYITHRTGRYGLGNRPGRKDFNTGALTADTFPYGRREQTFPIWSHEHGILFPRVVFQNEDEKNLSHPVAQSSPEAPPAYCRPFQPSEVEFDTGTCATPAETDKGKFLPNPAQDPAFASRYPPRSDIKRDSEDSPDVDLFRTMNPFDAMSYATPPGGVPATIAYAAPQRVDFGAYTLNIETSKTYDFNATYNPMSFPAPTDIPWADYGMPWRGQPSIVYRIPITIAMIETSGSTDVYAGYGDPSGDTGTLNPPDATITTDTPGSGGSRLQLVSDGGAMYRVRVRSRPDFDATAPAPVGGAAVTEVTSTSAMVEFIATGDDGTLGKLTGYDIRISAEGPITTENFAEASPIPMTVTPVAAGGTQSFAIPGLLPETDYWIGIRPYDNCFNRGELTVVKLTTLDREVAEVDWCFVATAAYGSAMVADVGMLRQFRDSVLESSILGELAIETYYTFGPAAAGLISESDLLRASARAVLGPIIARVRSLAN